MLMRDYACLMVSEDKLEFYMNYINNLHPSLTFPKKITDLVTKCKENCHKPIKPTNINPTTYPAQYKLVTF